MIIPGVVSATFRDKDADTIIQLCKKANLKAIEWSENAQVMAGDEEGARVLRKKTIDAGLSVAAYGSYYRLGQQDGNIEKVFRRSIVSAAALGAPTIRIWAGTKPSCDVEDAEREKLACETAEICDIAKEYGIKIALEWHKDTLTDTNESAKRFLLETNNDNLYCLWQPTVALSMNERVEGLDMLGDKLLNLHIYYWLDGVKRPLKEGINEWQMYLEHVDRDIDRFGLLEFVMDNSEEQFLEDAKELLKLVNEFNQG